MDVSRVVESTGDPAWAVDQTGRIVAWNRAAESFFGWSDEAALQRSCADLLRGRDLCGNLYCCASCPLLEMASRNEPVHGFELDLATATGELVPAAISVIVLRPGADGELALVHQVVSVAGSPTTAAESAQRSIARLSEREGEVLRLIAEGLGTKSIGDRLFISRATVRNHIQHIFEKLEVHSRIEAVALYQRRHSRWAAGAPERISKGE